MDEGLVIGCATGYDFSKIRAWISTLRYNHGGRVVLFVSSDMSDEDLTALKKFNVETVLFSAGGMGGIPPHVGRFGLISNYLRENYNRFKYSLILTTDVRDVIFQDDDPFNEIDYKSTNLTVSTENLLYKNEPWGARNLRDTFNTEIVDRLSDREIINVGVFGGTYDGVLSASSFVFDWCVSTKPSAIMDQAVFNYYVNIPTVRGKTNVHRKWCVNLGTTEHAIKAGAGDIGQDYLARNGKMDLSDYGYRGDQPTIDSYGNVYLNTKRPAIVHQWDRVPALKAIYDTV